MHNSIPSQVDPPTHFLVAWPARNLLIAWPSLQHRKFCFGFYRLLRFCHFTHVWVLFRLYVWTCFIPNVPFICYLSIPVCSRRVNRVIYWHIFSRPVGAQFADCMICLTLKTFMFWFLQTIAYFPVYFCLCLNTSDNTDSLAWWIACKALSRA